MLINSKTGDKVFISWSGGKDSYLSLLMAKEKDLQIACLLSFVGSDGFSRSHGLKNNILYEQANSLGIHLEIEEVTWESYEEGFENAVKRLKDIYGITGGVFGDINLKEHREWIEKMSDRCNISYNLPLWMMEERDVSDELIRRGGKTLLVSIRNDLVDEKWLGKVMDPGYVEYCEKIGISPCGENGEAHTLVVDGPMFKYPLPFKTGDIKRKEKMSRIEIILT
ncbi:MAG: hypothetical protein SCJ97_04865 [Bacillota bacterium]|nr:hypothetical protein [Bacillota bacterium]